VTRGIGIRVLNSDEEQRKHPLTYNQLQEVNLALLEGLILSVHVMKDWDSLEEGRRKLLIGSLDRLIAQTEMIHEMPKPTTG